MAAPSEHRPTNKNLTQRIQPPRGSSVTRQVHSNLPAQPAKKIGINKKPTARKENLVKLAGMAGRRNETNSGDTTTNLDEPSLVSRDDLPPALTNTLDHIVGQLSLIGRTMTILEQRLTLTENRISGLVANTRGIDILQVDEEDEDRKASDEDDDDVEDEDDEEAD